VRSCHRMPFATSRWSRYCLPRRLFSGMSGAIRAHAASVSSPPSTIASGLLVSRQRSATKKLAQERRAVRDIPRATPLGPRPYETPRTTTKNGGKVRGFAS